jgi:hypothetical protein
LQNFDIPQKSPRLMAKEKKQLINAHTHVFTSKYVPPWLAKSILPWPFYYILHVRLLIFLLKGWFRDRNAEKYGGNQGQDRDERNTAKYRARKKKADQYKFLIAIERNVAFKILYNLFVFSASGLVIFFFLQLFGAIPEVDSDKWLAHFLYIVAEWLENHNILLGWSSCLLQWLLVIAILIWVKPSRRIVFLALGFLLKFLKYIPGKTTRALFERYLNIVKFSIYSEQSRIANRLYDQLPNGAGIVALPMDMKYMGAGKIKIRDDDGKAVPDPYRKQMAELAVMKEKDKYKDCFYPFVFVDPRRIREERDNEIPYFDYSLNAVTGKVELKKCFIKKYIEEKEFSGFKIYPALGYFPFDEDLLPLWKYAADNQIPIMTHCVMGVIYYRGKKEKEWDRHPIFRQYNGVRVPYNEERPPDQIIPPKYEQGKEPDLVLDFPHMLLGQIKNKDYQSNFTHPLNYLCLLEEKILRHWVGSLTQQTKDVFGYTDPDTPLKYDLSNLKVCLAHYGGEEEWTRYLEQDRTPDSQRLIRFPKEGIDFSGDGKWNWEKLFQVWEDDDWFSIINSLILKYDNVYADISYIISKESIYPLLKYTLAIQSGYDAQRKVSDKVAQMQREGLEVPDDLRNGELQGGNKLRSRVLFGTDFYVVRNHKSDKDLYAEIRALLTEEEFDVIARDNTHEYLNL